MQSNNFLKTSLYILMLFMNTGFFMLIPYISIYFSEGLGLTATIIGVILAIRLFSQQGLTFFGGVFSDRFGSKKAIIIGCILRGCGFILFGLGEYLLVIILASILIGLGGALFSPSIRSTINYLSVSTEEKQRSFSILNIIENTSMMIGPLIGLVLLKTNFLILCVVVGVIYLASALFVYFLNGIDTQLNMKKGLIGSTFRIIIKDRFFLMIVLINFSFFYAVQQIYLLLPLTAEKIGQGYITGWAFFILSITVIIFQLPANKLIKILNLNEYQAMILGYFLLNICILPTLFIQTSYTLIIFVIGIAMSLIFINPSYQTAVGKLSKKSISGAYYGFSLLSMAFGGVAGNLIGGLTFDLVTLYSLDYLPWALLLIFTTLSMVSLFYVSSQKDLNIVKKIKSIFM